MNHLLITAAVVFTLFTSCNKSSTEKNETITNPPVTKSLDFKGRHDSLEAELRKMYDTTFASGYYLKYTLTDSNVIMINWGNKDFNRFIFDKTYPGWSPSQIETEWKGHIGLTHSGGTGIWDHILLPKNANDSTFYYSSDIAHDTIRNLIFYPSDKDELFVLENISTKKKQKITLKGITKQGFWLEGIDSLSFIKEGLYIRWKTDQYETPTQEKVFKIVINTP